MSFVEFDRPDGSECAVAPRMVTGVTDTDADNESVIYLACGNAFAVVGDFKDVLKKLKDDDDD